MISTVDNLEESQYNSSNSSEGDDMKLTLNKIISHVRDREYMSGVERDRARVKATGEVFTPTHLVQEMLDTVPQSAFVDTEKTFLDPTCGDGQFLGEILIRKMEANRRGRRISIDKAFELALSTIYGVDLMQDNVDECRRRLLCGQEHLRHIVENNIVCADTLTYDFKFGEPPTYDDGNLLALFDES